MTHRDLFRLAALAVLLLLAASSLSAQTVDNQIAQSLLKIFPELSKGYIDLNGNGKMDQNAEVDEVVPSASGGDSLLRAREILEFIIKNYQYIPSTKLGDVLTALNQPQGAIPEILSLQYAKRIQLVMQERQDLEANGIVLTPSALRDATAKMESLIYTLLTAYKKEGKDAEPDFVKARTDLFTMIGQGYPLPDAMGQEDTQLLTDIMINTLVRETQKDSPSVKLAVETLGRLKASDAVPYLIDLIKVPAVRTIAVRALGGIGDKASLSVLTAQLGTETDPQARVDLVRAIGAAADRSSEPQLLALLKSPDTASQPDMQRALVEALVCIAQTGNPDPTLLDVFKTNLTSDDPQVRILAIRGISSSKYNTQSSTSILAALKKESVDEVKIEAIAGLQRLELPTTVQTIITILQDPGSSDAVKKAAIDTLGSSANADPAVPILADLLGAPSATIRDAAAAALLSLSKASSKTVVPNLARVAVAKSGDDQTLAAATAVLAQLADPTSLPTLVALLSSPFPDVKQNVTWAIYRIKPAQNLQVVE